MASLHVCPSMHRLESDSMEGTATYPPLHAGSAQVLTEFKWLMGLKHREVLYASVLQGLPKVIPTKIGVFRNSKSFNI